MENKDLLLILLFVAGAFGLGYVIAKLQQIDKRLTQDEQFRQQERLILAMKDKADAPDELPSLTATGGLM